MAGWSVASISRAVQTGIRASSGTPLYYPLDIPLERGRCLDSPFPSGMLPSDGVPQQSNPLKELLLGRILPDTVRQSLVLPYEQEGRLAGRPLAVRTVKGRTLLLHDTLYFRSGAAAGTGFARSGVHPVAVLVSPRFA